MSSPAAAPCTLVWEGPFVTTHSLALVNRALCRCLLQRGHHLTLFPAGLDESAETTLSGHPDLAPFVSRTLPDDALHVSHRWPPRLQRPAAPRWAVMQPWEFGSIPAAWLPILRDHADEVWIPSRFVRDCFLRGGLPADKVHVIPNGVDPQLFRPGLEPFPLRTAAAVKFLFVGGTIHRKGINVLLDAYRRAFTRQDNVCLVVKDMGAASFYRGQTAGELIARFQADPRNPRLRIPQRRPPLRPHGRADLGLGYPRRVPAELSRPPAQGRPGQGQPRPRLRVGHPAAGRGQRVPGDPITLRLVVSRVCDSRARTLAVWYLLTNVPAEVETATVALWYCWRWRMETFHNLLRERATRWSSGSNWAERRSPNGWWWQRWPARWCGVWSGSRRRRQGRCASCWCSGAVGR